MDIEAVAVGVIVLVAALSLLFRVRGVAHRLTRTRNDDAPPCGGSCGGACIVNTRKGEGSLPPCMEVHAIDEPHR